MGTRKAASIFERCAKPEGVMSPVPLIVDLLPIFLLQTLHAPNHNIAVSCQ
jgi:hypothetical protein